MARIRTIKPEFWRNRDLALLTEFERLLAIALLNISDDHGYFEADPRLVRGEVFPFEESSGRTTVGLRELCRIGYIEILTHPHKGEIGRVCKFAAHQVINKTTKSKLAVFFEESKETQDYRSPTVVLLEDYRPEQGTGNMEMEREQGEGKGNFLSLALDPVEDLLERMGCEFRSEWASWKKHLLSKTVVLSVVEEPTILKDLITRFPSPVEAGLVIRFSMIKRALHLIVDGSHNRKPGSTPSQQLPKSKTLLERFK